MKLTENQLEEIQAKVSEATSDAFRKTILSFVNDHNKSQRAWDGDHKEFKVNEDSFLDDFLPKICLTPATVEVVDKNGNIKGYITDKELSTALTKTHLSSSSRS